MLNVKGVVHVLQHVLDANLLAVADGPDAVELQSLDDSTLQNEDRCGTRARHEVHALRTQFGNGLCEHAVVLAVQQTDAVRPDEGGTILLADVQDALLHERSGMSLLAEACGDDDKCLGALVACQELYGVWAQLGRNHQYGQFCRWQLTGIVEDLDALNLVFLRVDDTQCSLIAALYDIAHDGSPGLVYVVGAAYDNNRLGVEQFSIDHTNTMLLTGCEAILDCGKK